MSTIPLSQQTSTRPPPAILPFDDCQPETIRLYPLSNYTFGVKEAQPEEDPSVKERLRRLEDHYEQHGMRRTCEAVLVCHEHNHPHVLMIQIANAFFKLPGDYILATSNELAGLKARLNERLEPTGSLAAADQGAKDWNITHALAQWYRPNFEQNMYPYLPPHITRPKECKKVYLVQLEAARTLSVPKNMKLLAVPLFELYDNAQRYGPQLSAIPHYLSRFRWEFVDEKGNVVAETPGAKERAGGVKVIAGGDGDKIKREGGDEVTMGDAGGSTNGLKVES